MARSRGWLLAPVIGAGTEDDPIRAAVADRQSVDGDRLEYVIGEQDLCLVAYEVADAANMGDHGGEVLAGLDELDLPVGQERRASRLDSLARDLRVGRAGSVREVLRRAGRAISPTFDERLHLGTGQAPPSGSFVVDTFTDANSTLLEDHVPEAGTEWVRHPESPLAGLISNNRAHCVSSGDLALYYAADPPAGSEYTVEAVVHQLGASGSSHSGPAGRLDDVANTHYALVWEPFSVAAWLLLRVVAGTITVLGSYADTVGDGNAKVGTLELLDATKKGFVDGVERISSSDNTISAAGRAGVRLQRGSPTTRVHLDSITATDAGGGETGSGSVAVSANPTVETEGAKAASGEVAVSADPSVVSAGVKHASGGVAVAAEAAVSTNGFKAGSGSVSVDAQPTVATTATKHAAGGVSVAANPTVVTSGGSVEHHFGSASIAANPTVTAGGSKTARGTAGTAAECSTSTTGIKSAAGACSTTALPAVSTAGTKAAFGAALVSATSTVAATGSTTAATAPARLVLSDRARWTLEVSDRETTVLTLEDGPAQ